MPLENATTKNMNKPVPFEKLVWSAMHGAGAKYENGSTIYYEGMDGSDLIVHLLNQDPEIIPQSGYFTDTMVIRFEKWNIMQLTLSYFWYNFTGISDQEPDVYNQWLPYQYYANQTKYIKLIIRSKIIDLLQNGSGQQIDTTNMRIKTVGFGNRYYMTNNNWYEAPKGSYHGLEWFTVGKWHSN